MGDLSQYRKPQGWIEVWLGLFALILLGATGYHIIDKHKDSEINAAPVIKSLDDEN